MKANRNSVKSNAQDKMFETFTAMMIKEIESISTNWKKTWFTDGAIGMPRNLDGRNYHGTNIIFLWLLCQQAGYKFPIFATFDAINKLNKECPPFENRVHVKKGEKSLPVFFFIQIYKNRETKETITSADFDELPLSEQEKYSNFPRMIIYNVFNIEQTNMKELRPDLWEKYTQESILQSTLPKTDGYNFEPLDTIINNQSWICPIKCNYGNRAYYNATVNEIVVPQKEQFPCGGDFVKTTFHEMVHSTGHRNQLDRFGKFSKDGKIDYAREELVAELTAAMTAAQYGMPTHIKEDSAPYLKSWLQALQKEPDFLKTVLSDVRKANDLLSKAIDKAAKQGNAIAA